MLEINKIYFEDCLVGMQGIDDKSIDMILCDLPYGTTACKWDVIIPFEPLWEQYKRIIKNNGSIILFGNQPFTSILVTSNIIWFKYELIWKKNVPTGYFMAKKRPMKIHENILVFYNKQSVFNPQMIERTEYEYKKSLRINDSECFNAEIYGGGRKKLIRKSITDQRFKYPTTICEKNKDRKIDTKLHPTQKPVALFEYLIKTYSNENDFVLDNCMGSGTTAIACLNTNRNYIGFENDPKYFEIANQRILEHKEKLNAL
jgi:site-specific DNA-methyltransferase (adenine-specific)